MSDPLTAQRTLASHSFDWEISLGISAQAAHPYTIIVGPIDGRPDNNLNTVANRAPYWWESISSKTPLKSQLHVTSD
ncbi:uncharacterized protein ASCRUDRAFT_83149 [Ascoidea rubescens DSM 1968]|uniref:Uncharacterized protein n=1 Tax=Ascoidea rubescens DSM 1968 TaxID=1344418 RepID=A0A1D2V8F6_9ASCO|nr:hypothetical protein ASCRUDRAFT_83149 [Ascoidea rubescens DSM 1968]ODV57894.1 hypothetical protein ASCRUDRAFT_83149 [Ascoidea rubescens DSM 1968]